MSTLGLVARFEATSYAALEILSDEAVYERVRAGESEALRVLFDRHGGMLRRLALKVLGDAHESEDIAQDVFVSLWRAKVEWRRSSAKFTTWLYRVAINRAIDRRRKMLRAPHASEDIAALADAGPSFGPSAQEASVDQREQHGMLAALLQRLPEMQRRALTLHYFDDMSVVEMAQRLELSEQAVRALLKRGRAALRARFDKGRGDGVLRRSA